jgi:2-dehydropantoate 2-reductase
MALRRFTNVYAMLVNLPAIHVEPGLVVTHATGTGGILDTGRFPAGADSLVDEFTARLTRAGFSARPDTRVMRKKYAKLLMNLGNIVEAATVGTAGERTGQQAEPEALAEIYRCLRGEALACYEAASIDCASRAEVRERHENTYSTTKIPGFDRSGGSSWQSLSRGTGNVETEFLNGEISLLGALHGVPTPANRVCQDLAVRMVRDGLAVGSFGPGEILKMIEQAAEEMRR